MNSRYLQRKLVEKWDSFVAPRRGNILARAVKRFKMCPDKKSPAQIRREMNMCEKFWHCSPLQYIRYDLYRKNKELSDHELIDYIPEFFFFYLFLRFHDTSRWSVLLEDKNVTEHVFKSLQISQPDTIGKIIRGGLYTANNREMAYKDFERTLKEKDVKKLFVKPVDGKCGFGIFAFGKENIGAYVSADKQTLTEEFLKNIGTHKNYIIQVGIEQDKELNKIYSHSVNTFRIITENIQGNVRIICSILRVGKGGNFLDNSAQGGIVVKVDIYTGELGAVASTDDCDSYFRHPDSHYIFRDKKIVQWDAIKKFVLESAQKLPYFMYMGWDIALTEKGPLAIESNLQFALGHHQVVWGGLREKFNIMAPRMYWNTRKILL